MKAAKEKMSSIAQNVVLGTITGVAVAYNLRIVFMRVGGADLVWIFFIFLGPALGYLSGKERQRLERIKAAKMKVEEDLSKVQSALNQSTKKYRLLVEYANDAIFLTTVGGRFLLFNEAMCLMSGYTKKKLKNMNISQLQTDDHLTEKHRKAWLDNGIYRYEETWRSKDGDEVILDINARYIKLGEHQVILHVARDVVKQSGSNQETRAQDIRSFQENKLMEMSSLQNTLCRFMSTPLLETTKMFQYLIREYPQQSGRLTEVLSGWNKAQKLMQLLSPKNARDLKTEPCRWDLNEILKQELFYLELLTKSKGIFKQVSLAPDLPVVFGFGRDFSLIFGTIFRAALESVKQTNCAQFLVSTHSVDEQNLVEIHNEDRVPFKEHLCKITDPFLIDDSSSGKGEIEIEFLACQRFIESLGARIDVGEDEGGSTAIKIRIPSIQEKKEEVNKFTSVVSSEESLII